MKGLELSRAYFEEFGLPMLKHDFPELLPYLALGLVGSGSEVLGFDDCISTDHDFEPGFCIFIPDEAHFDRKNAFRLERAYSYLPKEFEGFKRSNLSPVGGNRHGVIRTSDFYKDKIGSPDGNLDFRQWLSLSDYSLLEATNGEIYADPYGEFTAIRNKLSYYPEDIRLKKLCAQVWMMAQAGPYNYERILSHGEPGAAQLSLYKYSEAAIYTIFLINKQYMPYYKWSFRALRTLPFLSDMADSLEFLLSENNNLDNAKLKTEILESIDNIIIDELKKQKLCDSNSSSLESYAYDINNHIEDEYIRNLHLLAAL